MSYQVDILYRDLTYKATVRNLAPLDNGRHFLEYSHILSGFGKARFRVGKNDPLLASEGDILVPFKYHVRIKRAGAVVWQGVIVKNKHRNKRFIEVEAFTYSYLLARKRIKHDASITAGDNLDNYRAFSTGTMATAVTNIVNEGIASAGVGSLAFMTIGTITNPNFPSGYAATDGTALTGAWTFSTSLKLQFSYVSLLSVIQALALYATTDFKVTDSLVFNFGSRIGRSTDFLFTYGEFGNIEDYDIPQDGEAMANDLMGVSIDVNNQILHIPKQDTASIAEYGPVEAVAAYSDVRDKNTLTTRVLEELRLVSTPNAEMSITLNDKAPQVGEYVVGDTVRVKIQDGPNRVDQRRRIVGISTSVHITGKETISLHTNKPRDGE